MISVKLINNSTTVSTRVIKLREALRLIPCCVWNVARRTPQCSAFVLINYLHFSIAIRLLKSLVTSFALCRMFIPMAAHLTFVGLLVLSSRYFARFRFIPVGGTHLLTLRTHIVQVKPQRKARSMITVLTLAETTKPIFCSVKRMFFSNRFHPRPRYCSALPFRLFIPLTNFAVALNTAAVAAHTQSFAPTVVMPA